MSTLAHHGIIYVPLGYKTTFALLANLDEVRGGSPWGAGTFAVSRFNILDVRMRSGC
jgi:NAD(P)H dehydrogenase (quinone)